MIESLPSDIIVNVISRVPGLDLIRMRFVSKKWKSEVDEAYSLLQLPYARSIAKSRDNQVVMFRRGSSLCFLELADEDRGLRAKMINLRPWRYGILRPWWFQIIGSCNGLLCLMDLNTERIIILNPFTNQGMLVPEHELLWDWYNSVQVLGFGYDLTRNVYKVMIKFHGDCCIIYDTGSQKWTKMGKELGQESCKLESRALSMNGKFYWFNKGKTKVFSFDWNTKEFRSIRVPLSFERGPRKDCHGLIILEGYICITKAYPYQLKFWVMKQHSDKERWVRRLSTRHRRSRIAFLQVLGRFENGKILLKCPKTNAMLLYDSKSNEYKFIECKDGPRSLRYESTKCKEPLNECVHIPSLNWM